MLESVEASDGKNRIAAPEPLVFPLSFGQQRLWFLDQLEPGISAYSVAEALRLMGPLQVECLERAIGEIARRHEALRTTFALVNSEPMQIVAPTVPTRLEISDLSHLPGAEREPAAAAEAAELAHLPFDLQRGPLLRPTLFVLGAEEHILLLVMHHIISEGGWSMSIFLRELGILYNAYSSGQASPLPELPLQYGDYAVWQRDTLLGEALQPHLSYWKAQLEGAPPVVDWPADRPRPAEQSYRGARQSIFLPKNLKDVLNTLSRGEGVTLFMTLLAAFQTLLFRFTGQADLPVGVPVAGRTPQTKDLIGMFINTIVLRQRLSGGVSFRQLMRQVRRVVFDGLAHQDMPFEAVVEAVRPERSMAFMPLFQVMFAFQNAPRSELELTGINVTPFEIEIRSSKIDLTLYAWEQPDGLRIVFEYNTDLFEAATIRRMLTRFGILLDGVVLNPDEQLSMLPLLTEREQTQILYDWNRTDCEIPPLCAHELFEQQVLRNPEAVAVVFNQRQLSYAELNRRANQIAHYLQSQGVGPERLVGVCLPRSPEMVAALLGVWKAGGAYVPLDPSYPPERLSFMVQDAAVQVLLTEKSCEHLFSSAHVNAVCLDTDWPRIASEELSNPRSGATPANLAYVMYTSGSTGTPKGAMILHRGLVNYLTWAIQTYAVEAGGSVPVHSSISFDLTVTSLYAPLLAGGQVELLAEDAAAQSLLTALRRVKNRTLVKITPAHLELLSQQLSPQEAASMTKTFVIGGENLSAEKLRLWREFAPSTRLINEYGPTETVVGCCVYEVQPGDPASGTVPIGRPIANTQLYVLDSDLQPVALGETGELYIGGAGVARGYWNRPELTRERFVPDPFSNQPEARLYKSGDLARYRPDGTLECLGRADNQVKVRGYRIELGEIEATLAGHAGVQSCAVLAREDEPGNQQLVAYVSPVKDQSLRAELYPEECPEELRAFLERCLPDYMVPAHFVILESLPLTPNGKIDRKALPAPSRETIAPAEDFVAPRDSIEQLLAGIWARVLNVERVGIHDNFFDLGGHSLLAVRVVVEVDRLSRTRLPLATLLRAPTIAELAAILRKERWAPSWSSLVPLRSGGSTAPLFLMHSHGGNVLEYHPLVNCLDPDRPVYALQARGLDGYIVRNQTLEEMAAAYIAELRTLQPEGPYFLGGFCFGGILALEAAQQLTAAGQEVALVVLIQSTHPEAKRFSASTTMLQRWWYRTTKRLDLEAENLANRGPGYILERCRYLWTRACARAAIAFDNVTGRHPAERSSLSTAYILEAVAMENGKALEKYVPRPYGGDVLLFRAVHQLSGQLVDQTLGWKRVLHGALEVCEVPGHQQNLLLEPNVLRLGRELDSRLQASCTRREPSAALPPAA